MAIVLVGTLASLSACLGESSEDVQRLAGTIEIEWIDYAASAEKNYFLHTDGGERYQLLSSEGSWFDADAGDLVVVDGVFDDAAHFVVQGVVRTVANPSDRVGRVAQGLHTGEPSVERVLVILLELEGPLASGRFYNPSSEHIAAIAADMVQWYLDSSFGQFTFAFDVVGPYSTTNDSNAIDLAVANDGIDPTNYSRTLLVGNYAASWCGIANGLGGTRLKTNTRCDQVLKNSVHELGHSLGLGHASFHFCPDQPLAATGCVNYEYGDGSDAMGATTSLLNAPHRERLGWLGANSIGYFYPNFQGTILLRALDRETDDLKVLRVFSGGSELILSFRRREGFNQGNNIAGFFDGLHIHRDGVPMGGYADSQIIDPIPGPPTAIPDLTSPVLPMGASFTDPVSEYTIGVQSMTDDGITIYIDVPPDTDGDHGYDHKDNCVLVKNYDQQDADSDGFGDRCDPTTTTMALCRPSTLGRSLRCT